MWLKRIFYFIIVVCSFNFAGCSDDSPVNTYDSQDDRLSDGKLCILAIGNSFSADAVEQNLYDLFNASGIEVVIGNVFLPGCSLETHWNNTQENNRSYSYRKIVKGYRNATSNVSLEYAISDEKWDIITFQQASGLSGIYSSYSPYLENLIEWVEQKSDAELWFHQTWAYSQMANHADFPKYDNDQEIMYQSIVDASIQTLSDNPKLKGIIPSGTAIQNGRSSFLGDTFNRDGYHLEKSYGQYTAACAWFETLSGHCVMGNTFKPASIDEQTKEVCQKAAHLAVESPFEITWR